MPFLLVIMERQVAAMYEEFFELMHTPFTRDIPADRLYSSRQIEEALGRLTYVADRQLFAVVTADPGCGKSTLIRMFESRLPKDKYMLLYLSDSKLTPRWLYAGLLDQMGLEASSTGEIQRGSCRRKSKLSGPSRKRKWCLYWMKPICWGRKFWKNFASS